MRPIRKSAFAMSTVVCGGMDDTANISFTDAENAKQDAPESALIKKMHSLASLGDIDRKKAC
jgi:hypothetical protein